MLKQFNIYQIMKAHCGTREVRSRQCIRLWARSFRCMTMYLYVDKIFSRSRYKHQQLTKDMIKFWNSLIYTQASGLSTQVSLGTNLRNIKL